MSKGGTYAVDHAEDPRWRSPDGISQLVQEIRAELGKDRGPEVMNLKEAAGFLGVDHKTLAAAALAGEVPSQKLGKRWLFSRTALVAWLGQCKSAASGRLR